MKLTLTARRAGRLSSFLKNELKMSTGLVNKVKWADGLRVNGISCHTDYPVRPGDVITVLLQEEAPEYPAEDGSLTVVFEDDWLLAVDKPVGMLIHPSRNRITGTLANLVQGYYAKTGQQGAFHPLTRLDRDTFGIVLIAKNSHIHALLQQQKPQKTYEALTYGGPEADDGIIDAPIARKELPSLLREIRPDGKPSVTHFHVLERGTQVCRLSLEPVTGRTHQLRLHCACMGFPILGDPQYGSEASMAFSREKGFETQLLLAKRLEFIHPITGEPLQLETKLTLPELGSMEL
ncbi:RluA family pseudouridine synthase [Pseudoflavonifractor sp. MSJ-30]|uniref:RluA family pseudouridine synthase n=1 Tax=Pseudoflavonifractor sp. MSJ-30 TaxID=2841525 RepID=UPI001C1198B6|nr:RluA family pseudouridine synthase [Pseudoflavonifractor sp. MSJ-30]MBU5452148.1 RluA family pseudouridine synthase [Pseudoflavonifractor sp. MSJ-30]